MRIHIHYSHLRDVHILIYYWPFNRLKRGLFQILTYEMFIFSSMRWAFRGPVGPVPIAAHVPDLQPFRGRGSKGRGWLFWPRSAVRRARGTGPSVPPMAGLNFHGPGPLPNGSTRAHGGSRAFLNVFSWGWGIVPNCSSQTDRPFPPLYTSLFHLPLT